MRLLNWRWAAVPVLLLTLAAGAACNDDGGDGSGGDNGGDGGVSSGGSVTVYSGRSETLIGPLLQRFQDETGITVQARYGSTTEMATTILEEGANSPADVFIAQDTGGLGAVQNAGLFASIPDELLDRVDPRWRSDDGGWVGLSGRARVLVYNTEELSPDDLPDSVFDLVEPEWRGRVGWAPGNASFQAFVTAMRLQHGEDTTREWLEGMLANDVVAYGNNTGIVEAVAAGEVDLGLVNHYYLHGFLAERGESFPARNHYLAAGDTGSLVGVAGAGILASSKNQDAAERLIEFLLSDESQRYFADETYEYPVVASVEPNADLPGLGEIQPPDIDLDDLEDLEGTLALLRDVGALE